MIVLGRVVAAYGLRGWLKLHCFADDPQAWKNMPHWWLGRSPDGEAGSWQRYAVENARLRGNEVLAKLSGVADRTAAEALDGCYVAAPREALPKTAEDEYYWADLIGLEVVSSDGAHLGKVTGLLSTGAHEVLQVEDNGQQRLLPFVAPVIIAVDAAAGIIRVDWDPQW